VEKSALAFPKAPPKPKSSQQFFIVKDPEPPRLPGPPQPKSAAIEDSNTGSSQISKLPPVPVLLPLQVDSPLQGQLARMLGAIPPPPSKESSSSSSNAIPVHPTGTTASASVAEALGVLVEVPPEGSTDLPGSEEVNVPLEWPMPEQLAEDMPEQLASSEQEQLQPDEPTQATITE